MSVRSDLESRLAAWVALQTQTIEVAWEGWEFDKPPSDLFIQPIIIPARSINASVDGVRYREIGIFQVNVWGIDGKGSGETESIAQSLINFFPVFPKFSSTSIDQIGHIGQAEPINGYRVLPVSFYYRRETQTN